MRKVYFYFYSKEFQTRNNTTPTVTKAGLKYKYLRIYIAEEIPSLITLVSLLKRSSYLWDFVVIGHGGHDGFEAFEFLVPHMCSVLFQNGLGPCLDGALMARSSLDRRRSGWNGFRPAHCARRLQSVSVSHPNLGLVVVVVIVGFHLRSERVHK